MAYNLPGIPSGLKLSPAVITGMFSGKVSRWNDFAIQSLNRYKKTVKTITYKYKTKRVRKHGKIVKIKTKTKIVKTTTSWVDSPKLPNQRCFDVHRRWWPLEPVRYLAVHERYR